MADRGDPWIHLYDPGLIRGIKNEVETHEAGQIEAFHHAFSDHRHLRMIDKPDDTRRPIFALYFQRFDADPCKNFAPPAYHRRLPGRPGIYCCRLIVRRSGNLTQAKAFELNIVPKNRLKLYRHVLGV